MYSEFELKRQSDKIANGDDSPMRKARRLLSLSHLIGRFCLKVGHGAVILERDEDEGAGRLMDTVDCLKRLQQEARLAAFNALKGKPKPLGFRVNPEATAYPVHWADTKERLDDRLGYN